VLLRALCLLPLAAIAALGQTPDNPYTASLDAIEASVTQQRESVARQLSIANPSQDRFFHASWPMGSDPLLLSMSSPVVAGAEPVDVSTTKDCAPIPPSELQGYIEEVSRREGISPKLLRAVIRRESAFYPCAVSQKGAQGLMQIMPETGADLGLGDPFDPWENVDAGARFLGQLLVRYGGDISLALGAYNAGPARVEQYDGLPPIPETLDYVADILDDMRVVPLEILPGLPTQVVPWEVAAPLNLGKE